ncbi:hypothetical protein AB0L47_24105 [Streptomyces bobili]
MIPHTGTFGPLYGEYGTYAGLALLGVVATAARVHPHGGRAAVGGR